MNIGIFVNTPAQAHFYKNIAKILEKKGHSIKFVVRDYGETLDVMNGFGLKFYIYSRSSESKIAKIMYLPIDIFKGSHILQRFNTEVLLGFGGQETYSAFLLRRPSIVFQDSEPHINFSYLIQYKMFVPLMGSIITTKAFSDNLGQKQIRVDSFKEIAYLHPKYFVPKEEIFNFLKIDKNEKFVIIRFNAFDAVHDSGMNGFSLDEKKYLIEELRRHIRVFISAEKKVPKELEKYLLNIPKQKIHDCLYYANMLITDTQTMTTEAAILGTPVVRCNSFVGPNDMGNFIELEKKYQLIFSIRNSSDATEKAISLIQDPDIKKEWSKRKQKLLNDKIDMTAFMVWYIENYPESYKEMKENPEIQYKFR